MIESIKGGQIDEALTLIADADMKETDSDGRTAQYWATKLGLTTVVRALTEHGADVNEPITIPSERSSKYESTLLLLAIQEGRQWL